MQTTVPAAHPSPPAIGPRSFWGKVVDTVVDGAAFASSNLYPRRDTLGTTLAQKPMSPRPVVIVPGFATGTNFMNTWKASLERDGFPTFVWNDPEHVAGGMDDTARRLGIFVDEIRALTGAKEVDIVGYSAGGVAARALVSLQQSTAGVASLVTVGTEHHGDNDWWLLDKLARIPFAGNELLKALPQGEWDLVSGSEFMHRLDTQPPVPANVRLTSIYSVDGDGITPAETSIVYGATNVALSKERHGLRNNKRGPGHLAMATSSNETYEAIRTALLAGTASS